MNHNSLHLCIIWKNSLSFKDKILQKIDQDFEFKKEIILNWDDKYFLENLQRFYGATLPDPEKKIKTCGKGEFSVIIFNDISPKFEKRKTSKGSEIVNCNVYDFKFEFRKEIGKEFAIHASNNERETEHDLALLFGKNLIDFSKSYLKNNNLEKITRNISGHDGWNSVQELFYVLNSTTNYVILRNFENLENEIISDIHNDIDIMTDDLWQISYIVNKKIYREYGKHQHLVKIDEKYIKIDFKQLGDNYYDKKWENQILKKKIIFKNLFFVPDKINYFYTLLYHAIEHKNKISEDYKNKLKVLSGKIGLELDVNDNQLMKQLLVEFLKKNEYKITNTKKFKIIHNMKMRVIFLGLEILRKNGIPGLTTAIRHKMYRRRLIKSGRI